MTGSKKSKIGTNGVCFADGHSLMLFDLFKQCWNTTLVKGQMISVNRFQRECTLHRIGRMEVIARKHTHTHIRTGQGGNRMVPLGKKESKRG